LIGILGGMGPEATNDLYKKIIKNTDAKKDQDHIHVFIDSNTSIPDRSAYINGNGEDPRPEMIKSLLRLEVAGAKYVAIPCNTAHYFYDDLKKCTNINIINMIAETAKTIRSEYPDCFKLLLLATTGTYNSGIYKKVFEVHGLEIIEPSNLDKEIVMKWIYDYKSGKSSVKKEEFEKLIEVYSYEKTEMSVSSGPLQMPVILGCTEIPLIAELINAKGNFVDPTMILAKKCVELGKQ